MLDARQKKLIQNCIIYANSDPAGMPGHNLALLVAAMQREIDELRSSVRHGDCTQIARDNDNLRKENASLKATVCRISGEVQFATNSLVSVRKELDLLEARNYGNAN